MTRQVPSASGGRFLSRTVVRYNLRYDRMCHLNSQTLEILDRLTHCFTNRVARTT
ncbi:hypothetical protein IQ235_09605 [Oscillatoriales cyanobacterium LEGE 11467]|uniref:Uncharacterized protein n=1 Tax=Zarconia navalis LEGE 11467 TaxID=1828826 RepID=A0A928Z8V9_9CYAN|nr:hypothetical protein [Zarconia navalis]MBE9041034.1 hypothetical protein [Zarconia navalis LEGE 11467]